MVLLEIAAQGVPGLNGAALRLRPGYNVLAAVDGAALRRVVMALLAPDADGQGAATAAMAASRPARGGLTLLGDDGLTYRVLREFGGGWQLHRLDPARRAFAPVTSDPAAVAEHLHGAAGVPSPGRLALLALAADDLPSRRAELPPGRGEFFSAPANVREPRPGSAAGPGASTRGSRAALEQELAAARVAERVREQLDDLQGRLFRLEELLQEGNRLRERVAEAERSLAELGGADAAGAAIAIGAHGAPSAAAPIEIDPHAVLEEHRRAAARRDDALDELANDRAALGAQGEAGPPRPFWRAGRFWAGVAAGAVAVAGGVAGHASGARYLALLDIPAFGWAGWVALGWVGAVDRHRRAERRRAALDDRERRVLEAYGREAAPLQRLTAALGVEGEREVEAALLRVETVRQELRTAREALDAHEARPEVRSAGEERTRLEAELRRAEQLASAEAGRLVRSPVEVERDLARLRAAGTGAGAGAGSVPEASGSVDGRAEGADGADRETSGEVDRAGLPGGGSSGVRGERPRSAGVGPEAAFSEVLAQTRRELPWSLPVAAAIQRQASLALATLSGGRLAALALEGAAVAVETPGGRLAPAALAAPDRDLAWIALRLAVMERLLGTGQTFALVEDVLGAVPDGARRAAARLLKGLSRTGQLLHSTADAACRDAADHQA